MVVATTKDGLAGCVGPRLQSQTPEGEKNRRRICPPDPCQGTRTSPGVGGLRMLKVGQPSAGFFNPTLIDRCFKLET